MDEASLDVRVQRASRRNNSIGLCGCLAATLLLVLLVGAGAVIVFLRTPALALVVAGFKPQGSTAQVFVGQADTVPVTIENALTPDQVVIDLGASGTQILPASSVQTGTIDGQAGASVSFSESDLMTLCRQRTNLCSDSNPQYRNVRVDLQPGGGVVYADVNVPELGLSQTIGVVLRLDASQRQFEIMGVDTGGTLYGLPSGGVGQRVQEIAAKANTLLREAHLDADGGVYSLTDIHINSDRITFVMR